VEETGRNRRSFLRATLGAAAGLSLLSLHLAPRGKGGGSGKVIVSARASDVPEEGALVFRKEQVALVREGGRFRAMSLACTHLGCTVTVAPDRIECPCHGSVFDLSGKVVRGPADRPLPSLRVEERRGTLLVLDGGRA
jgi:Rieske Fe-S protein